MNRWTELFQMVALAAFLLLFVGRTIQLRLTHGVRVISLVSGKPPFEAVLGLLFVIAFPLWMVDVVLYAWPASGPLAPLLVDPQLFRPDGLQLGGAALQLGGIALFGWSLWSFGASWRVGVDRQRPGQLVTSGVFAWSRNPIFLAMDLYLIGAVLLTGRLVPLVFAVAMAVGFHLQIRNEERFLAARHGSTYRAYRRQVRRYLGRTTPGAAWQTGTLEQRPADRLG